MNLTIAKDTKDTKQKSTRRKRNNIKKVLDNIQLYQGHETTNKKNETTKQNLLRHYDH